MLSASNGLGVGLDHFNYNFFEAQRAVFQGGGWQEYFSNASNILRAHNEYLDLLIEGGIFLLTAWLLLIFNILRKIKKAWEKPEYVPFAGIFIYILLVSFVTFPLHILPNLLLVGLAIAKLLAIKSPVAEKTIQIETTGKGIKLIAGMALLGLSFLQIREIEFQWNLYHGKKAITQNRYLEADIYLERAQRKNPKNNNLQLLQARLLYRRLRSLEALRTIQEIEKDNRSINTLKLKGLILMDLERWKEAFGVYKALSEAYPLHITPHYYLGRLYMRQGARDMAITEFQRTLTLKPISTKARREQEDAKQRLLQFSATE